VNPSIHRTRVGADVGSSLTKLAIRRGDEPLRLEHAPAEAIERVARQVESLRPERVGLTGGGAPRLAGLIRLDTMPVGEFDAWAAGARELLRMQGAASDAAFLLVSVGTGTSALRVEGGRALRVGGTALGGGTLLGLGAALTGLVDFDELVALADAGERGRVDLQIADVYPEGLAELPGAATAASFGKLARIAARGDRSDPRDLAGALVGLVGENVALLCNALAAQAGVRRIVFGGSALRGNRPLAGLLAGITAALGREAVLLANGEYAGALGALLLTEPESEPEEEPAGIRRKRRKRSAQRGEAERRPAGRGRAARRRRAKA
jgi:type II pantothenate kinase